MGTKAGRVVKARAAARSSARRRQLGGASAMQRKSSRRGRSPPPELERDAPEAASDTAALPDGVTA